MAEIPSNLSPGAQQRLRRLRDTGYTDAVLATLDDGREVVLPVVKEVPTFAGSVMVALYPDAEAARDLAVEGGLAARDLHVTLAYLGSADDLTVRDIAAIHAAAADVAAWNEPLVGEVSGLGVFHADPDDGHPTWASVDVPGLGRFRTELVDALAYGGVEIASLHDFTPHITLTYDESWRDEMPDELPAAPLRFDRITVAVGDERADYLLGDMLPEPGAPESDGSVAAARRPSFAGRIARSAVALAERLGTTRPDAEADPAMMKRSSHRFTLGPWYVPNQEDAHGEWTDPDELQQALWNYVDAGDRDVRLQHNLAVSAGRWVEALQWPHQVTVPVTLKDRTRNVTFPAGTVFLGVQWEPWAFDLVEKGLIRGFSIGGRAKRVTVDLTEA